MWEVMNKNNNNNKKTNTKRNRATALQRTMTGNYVYFPKSLLRNVRTCQRVMWLWVFLHRYRYSAV